MKLSACFFLIVHFCLIIVNCGSSKNQHNYLNNTQDTSFIDSFNQILRQKLSKTLRNRTEPSKLTLSKEINSIDLSDIHRTKHGSTVTNILKNAPTPSMQNGDINKDSIRSNCTFVPFEEWRLKNIEENPLNKEKRVRLPGQLDPLESDSIGDDMEIDIGLFSNSVSFEEQTGEKKEPSGKVYKHKFNFASLDCAATVVKTNSEASGASSILIENKDKYLLNPCSVSNQFVTIELCQDILVEEIVIANFEYFSSTFSKLRFSVSDQYPVRKNGWRILGEFDAENSKDVQTFTIKNPQIWARYLQIEVLSHHDNEYYCPISLLRVHGKTMMDDFRMESSKDELPVTDTTEVKSEEEVDQKCAELIEHCDMWPSFDPENMTLVPQYPDVFQNCRSKLKTLKFDEFLRNLNESICPPIILRETNTTSIISSSASSQPSFSTEESIFKNIMKRLISLEKNTTLTISYIEEQGKLLANSFEQLEKAQTIKFENLIVLFNETIMDNLNVLRVFANQVKDQSIRILEEQKLNTDQFTTQNMSRLKTLEEELKMQKTLTYAIISLFFLILIYMFLSKGEPYLDEMLKKDTLLTVNTITPAKYNRFKSTPQVTSSPISQYSFSESSNVSNTSAKTN